MSPQKKSMYMTRRAKKMTTWSNQRTAKFEKQKQKSQHFIKRGHKSRGGVCILWHWSYSYHQLKKECLRKFRQKFSELIFGNVISQQIIAWEVWSMPQIKANTIYDWLMKIVLIFAFEILEKFQKNASIFYGFFQKNFWNKVDRFCSSFIFFLLLFTLNYRLKEDKKPFKL